MLTDTQRLVCYLETELGNELIIAGNVYTVESARDDSVVLSNQTLAQIGRHVAAIHPPIIALTTEPSNTAVPVATGTGTVGQTLSCTNGTWKSVIGGVAFTYQWQRQGVNIAGTVASTYLLVTADSTHTVSCVVTATDAANGATSQASNGIAVA
jgi:hypothetical protein